MAEEAKVRFGTEGGDEVVNNIAQIREALYGLTNPLRALRGNLGEIAEAFLATFAVERIEEFTEKFAEMGAQIDHATHELGMSAERVSTLNVAFKAMGMGSEEASFMFERLERNMVQAQSQANGPAAAAFRALGISMEQVKSSSPDQMLDLLADKFSHSADGANKTAIAMDLLGRTGARMIPFLDAGRQGLEEFNKVAEQTGTVWTEEEAGAAERTAIGISTLGEAFDGLGKALFEVVEPAFDTIVKDMVEVVEEATDVVRELKPLGQELKDIAENFRKIGPAAQFSADTIEAYFAPIIGLFAAAKVQFGDFAQAITDASHGNLTKALKDVFRSGDDAAKAFEHTLDGVKDKIAEAQKSLQALMHPLPAGSGPAGTADSLANAGIGTGGSGGKQLSAPVTGRQQQMSNLMQQWRDFLQQKEIAENNFFADSKAKELQYWTTKRNDVQANMSWYVSYFEKEGLSAAQAKQKTDSLLLSLDAKVYEGMKSNAQQWMRDYKSGLDTQLADLKDQLATKTIDEQTWYTQSIQRLQAYLDLVKKTYGDMSSQYQQTTRQMDNIDKQHLLDMTKSWDSAVKTIENSFDTMLRGVLQGTQTWQQAMKNMAANLVLSFIEAEAKTLLEAAATAAKRLLLEQTTDGAIVASHQAANAANAASDAAVDIKPSVLKHAGSAAAAVYDDVSQIPYVGWLLAPPAAAAAFAAVAAFGSFAQGAYNIPSDMIAQIHAGEMIIPASIASQIRAGNTAIPAFGASASGVAGGDVHVHFNVSAIDGASVANMLKSNSAALTQTIATAVRNANSNMAHAARVAGGAHT